MNRPLSIITALCSRLGVSEVVTTVSGEEALKILAKSTFDLVLVDLMMPEMSGWELLKEIRANERTVDLPVYAVTGSVLPAADCREKGFTDVLCKPVTTESLRTLFMALANGTMLDVYWPMEPEPGIRYQVDWLIVTMGNVGNLKLERNTSFIDDLAYDSMDMVEFALEFKKKFGIEIPQERLGAIKTVGDVYDILVRNLRSCGSAYGRRRMKRSDVNLIRARGCAGGDEAPVLELPPDYRALVVDDMAICRRMLSQSLARLGVKDVEVVESGEAALAAIKAKMPSLVLTDLWMPGMDGSALLRHIRELPGGEVPVVCVTADNVAERSYDLSGFTAALVKPVTALALRGLISELVEGGD